MTDEERAMFAHVSQSCVCRSMREATRVVTQIYDTAFRPMGLRAGQFTILNALVVAGPHSMTVIAEALGMDRTTLVRNIEPLVERGYVTIERGEDRRARAAVVTEDGLAMLRQALPAWQQAQQAIVDALGQEFVDRLLTDLQLVAALETRSPATPQQESQA